MAIIQINAGMSEEARAELNEEIGVFRGPSRRLQSKILYIQQTPR
jgi:hypothetical protein